MGHSASTRRGLYGGPRAAYARFAQPVTKANANGSRRGLHGGPRARYGFFTIDDKVEVVLAWTTDVVTYQDGDEYTINWAGIADASALTDTILVNLSALRKADGTAPTTSEIDDLEVWTSGVYALLEWDHDSDDLICLVPAGAHYVLPSKNTTDRRQLFDDPGSAGGTGDIVLTTPTATASDTVSIYMKVLLK